MPMISHGGTGCGCRGPGARVLEVGIGQAEHAALRQKPSSHILNWTRANDALAQLLARA
jgi:hypothetical protein